MRTNLAFTALVGLGLVVTGCGGGGLGSIIPNSLAGVWVGPGTSSGNGADVIQASIEIGGDGTLSGTLTDETTHNVVTLGGQVSILGAVTNGTVSVANSTGSVLGSGSLSGAFTEVQNQGTADGLDATLNGTVSGSSSVFTFTDLTNTNPAVRKR